METRICQDYILKVPGSSIRQTYGLMQLRDVCCICKERVTFLQNISMSTSNALQSCCLLSRRVGRYLSCWSISDPIRVNDILCLYSRINSQIQCKASLSLPINWTSSHLNIFLVILFDITAQALALLNACIFLDSREFGLSYSSSDAKMSTHSVKTL